MTAGGPGPPTVRRAVSPLELFYDLVFVFAVSQLAHHLSEHLNWRGTAETGVLLVGVFSVWATTSFGATLLDIRQTRTRLVLLLAMGLGLFMNAGIARAFSDNGWLFAAPFLLIFLGNNTLMAVVAPTAILRRHYGRSLIWILSSTPLWIAGAATDPEARLWWWAAAATLDLLGVWFAHPLPGRALHSENLAFDADHMLERLRLFIILLLGETVLTAGQVIAHVEIELSTVLASIGIFVALVCLWGTYFGGGEDVVAGHLAATTDPIRSVRLGINTTYLGLAGLIIVAVGSERVITHPIGHSSAEIALLLFGGTALYLLAQACFFTLTTRGAWVERWWGLGVVVVLGLAAVLVPPLGALAVLDSALIVLVAVLIRVHRRIIEHSSAVRDDT